MKSRLSGVFCACLFTIISLSASAATINVGALDGGWYRSDGQHGAGTDSYLVGEIDPHTYRNWFAFDLGGITLPAGESITGATLSVQNGAYFGDSSEQWTVTSVETNVSDVMTGHPPGDPQGVAIFNDLQDGDVYGSTTINSSTGPAAIIDVSFTGVNAIPDITSSIGGLFAVGGYLSSLGSPLAEVLFSSSAGQLGSVNLVLETAPVPVPAAAWLFGSGLIGLVGVARRMPSSGQSNVSTN